MSYIALTTRSGRLLAVLGFGANRRVGVLGRAVGVFTSANDPFLGAA